MPTKDIGDRALDAATLLNAKGSEFEVVHMEPTFLDGSLVFFQFYDEDYEDDQNYVSVTTSAVLHNGCRFATSFISHEPRPL